MDDVTLGGLAEYVANDVSKIVYIVGHLGLKLNVFKCELIAHNDLTVTDDLLC